MRRIVLVVLATTMLLVSRPAAAQPWQAMTDTSIDMRPMFYPVKNQLFRGSCGTFAILGAMEFYPGVPRLSEAYVYATIKAEALDVDGATLEGMKEFLDSSPLVAEEKMPYELVGVFSFDEKKPTETAIGLAFNEKRGRQARLLEDHAIYKARGVRHFTKDDITWEWLERTLRSGKPIVIGFRMNGDHWTMRKDGFIHVAIVEFKDGRKQIFADDGGHAVLIVGYRTIYDPNDPEPDLEKRRTVHQLLIRNSWGVQWGEQGYGWVSWETYGKNRVIDALTIDGVDTVTGRHDQAPQLDLRAQGVKYEKDSYAVTLSTLIKSNYLPEGGIRSVEYTIFSGAAKMNEEFEKFPLGSKTSTDASDGFMVNFTGLSDSSLNVRMTVTYKENGKTVLFFPVPEFVSWNPLPDVELKARPEGTAGSDDAEAIKLDAPVRVTK
jgi:hypothetical protein